MTEWLLARLPRGARAVAMVGILVGLAAFWVALPPVHLRQWIVPAVLGFVGILLGAAAIRMGVRRLGWGAVVVGLLGISLGYLATRSSVEHLDQVVVWSALTAAMLRYATPLAFAAMIAGGGLALVHAFFAIHLRADQIVGGTAVNFLALGITGYFFFDLYNGQDVPVGISSIPNVSLPVVDDWKFIGPALGNLNLMVWMSFLLVIVSYVVVFKTPIGLRIRACGEHPRAADTVGINVYMVRYGAVVLSGVLAGLGGAYLSIGYGGGAFTENMTAGKGFIALAAVIFGAWRPFGTFAAALLFGFSTALAFRLPVYSDSAATLFQTLPYILTLIAVAGVVGRTVPPAADGKPYVRQ